MKKVSSLLSFLIILSACSTTKPVRKISSTDASGEVECEGKVVHKKSELQACTLTDAGGVKKKFHLFKGEGTPEEIQFSHGFLMAEQINHGSIEELLGYFERESQAMGKFRWAFEGLQNCHMNRLKESVSNEFINVMSAVAQGYAAGMKAKGLPVKYSEADFVLGLLGIEFGNVMGGIAHEAGEKPLKALAQVLGQCRIILAKEGIKAILKGLRTKQADDRKMGCVGLVAPDSFTGQGVIHGRNLDQTPLMKSWAKSPVIYLLKETGKIPYVAAGTAGLVYPGGISGFNQAGLSVSLHQMNTTRWDTSHKSGSAEVVPYLQQRILREARSIEEAFEIVKKTNVFSSWTIFISDSKDNDGKMISEVASIEVSARHKVIARRKNNEAMSQSNHFIDPKLQKEHYHSTLAAYLETQSRLLQMEKILNEGKGRIDVDWAMEALSSHVDYFEGDRSFGRTAVKLSNIMSSIAHPAKGEFWMTVGDKKPAAHSWYVGSRVDFEKMSLEIISMNKSYKMDSKAYLEKSYEHAVLAYQAYKAHDNKAAIVELLNANSLAALNGVEDTSITYNLARLYMTENDPTEAKRYMEKLLLRKSEFHPYHQGLISMYSARLRQLVGLSGGQVNDLYDEAFRFFSEQLGETKKKYDHAGPDLKKKIKLIKSWKKGKDKKAPALDFQVND